MGLFSTLSQRNWSLKTRNDVFISRKLSKKHIENFFIVKAVVNEQKVAKVSNHIATERLEEKLGTNELAPHGLVDVFHNQKWVKCSPAFNKELCAMYNVDVLNFDGSQDSILQEYNKDHSKFMTYLEDYGHFEDVPLERIKDIFRTNYPALYQEYVDNEGFNI